MEEVEVCRIDNDVEISIHNGGAGGWIRFDIHQISKVLGRLHEIRAERTREEAEEVNKQAVQIQEMKREQQDFSFRTPQY